MSKRMRRRLDPKNSHEGRLRQPVPGQARRGAAPALRPETLGPSVGSERSIRRRLTSRWQACRVRRALSRVRSSGDWLVGERPPPDGVAPVADRAALGPETLGPEGQARRGAAPALRPETLGPSVGSERSIRRRLTSPWRACRVRRALSRVRSSGDWLVGERPPPDGVAPVADRAALGPETLGPDVRGEHSAGARGVWPGLLWADRPGSWGETPVL
ncbi:hypothetical protein NDU88_010573 [Pleurodeles waltl]|uniref:Uncharacterized protein n=1 Tax=Pleurodeles waltl TaxID=8319 RepID=A0AAV7PYB5_PLEWA|nr:hypothetical protein NDU88_010573 [Pleurodeles waltl]